MKTVTKYLPWQTPWQILSVLFSPDEGCHLSKSNEVDLLQRLENNHNCQLHQGCALLREATDAQSFCVRFSGSIKFLGESPSDERKNPPFCGKKNSSNQGWSLRRKKAFFSLSLDNHMVKHSFEVMNLHTLL